MAESVREGRVGVRSTSPAMRAAAVSTSASPIGSVIAAGSPQAHAVFGREVKLMLRLYVKRVVPSVQIAGGADQPVTGRRMGIGEKALTEGAVTGLLTPDLSKT